MPKFDIYKALSFTSNSIKQLSVFNPLTIRKKGTRSKAIFALALVCFFWGTTWIASKEGVRHMPGLQMAGIRQLIGGLCYVTYFLAKGVTLPKGKEWVPIIIMSFLNFLMSNGLSTWGLQYVSSGLGAIMGAIFPLWIVIIGLFSVKDKMPVKAILGLFLGFAGVCTIFYEHVQFFNSFDFLLGVSLSLIATWTWAFGTIYTKQQAANFNPYFSLGLQMLISGTTLLLFTGGANSFDLLPFTAFHKIPWQSWAAIGYLVIFGSIISFIAYLYALQHLPTEQASIYAYVNPIVAVLLGAIIFNEKLTIFIGIGGLLALLGVYLVNKAFKALPPPEQPEPEGV